MTIHTDSFFADLEYREASLNTITSYRTALAQFETKLKGTPWDQVTADHVRLFLGKWKGNTKAAKLTALKSFYSYLIREEKITKNPLLNVAYPKKAQTIPEPPGKEEIAALLSSITKPRDKAIISLFYTTGLRVSELVALNRKDLKEKIKVNGKGKKDRQIFVSSNVLEDIKAYLDTRQDKNPALFISEKRGNRLTAGVVWYIIKGYGDHLHPHLFRHSFGTQLVAADINLRIIQEMMGHASPKTTEIYTHVAAQQLEEAHRVAFGGQ